MLTREEIEKLRAVAAGIAGIPTKAMECPRAEDMRPREDAIRKHDYRDLLVTVKPCEKCGGGGTIGKIVLRPSVAGQEEDNRGDSE